MASMCIPTSRIVLLISYVVSKRIQLRESVFSSVLSVQRNVQHKSTWTQKCLPVFLCEFPKVTMCSRVFFQKLPVLQTVQTIRTFYKLETCCTLFTDWPHFLTHSTQHPATFPHPQHTTSSHTSSPTTHNIQPHFLTQSTQHPAKLPHPQHTTPSHTS